MTSTNFLRPRISILFLTTWLLAPMVPALVLGTAAGCGDDDAAQDAGPPDAAADADTPQFDHPARVKRVIDGDTIVVEFLGQELTIRFKGVNTPELTPDPPEAFAVEAQQFTAGYAIPPFDVGLEFDDEACGSAPIPQSCFDMYDRLLAYIRTADGEDLNALLLVNGLARVYTVADFNRKTQYLQLESQAQAQGLGIWGP